MKRLNFSVEEIERLASYTLPWFSDTTRTIMGKPPLATPEYDKHRNVFFYESEEIDELDEWFLDVLRAGWAYVDSDPELEGLEAVQAAQDWSVWEAMLAQVVADEVTIEEAQAAATVYLINISSALGVPVPESLQ